MQTIFSQPTKTAFLHLLAAPPPPPFPIRKSEFIFKLGKTKITLFCNFKKYYKSKINQQ